MPDVVCQRWSLLFGRCLDDSLTQDEAAQLAEHLEQCAECRRALEAAAAGDAKWGLVARAASHDVRPQEHAPPGHAGNEESGHFGGSAADFAVHYLQPSSAADSIGTLDDIEILDVVGRGGMGIVLKGRQTSLQRMVAVKLLRPDLAERAIARKRFAREAQATAAVVHPNVMPIHAIRASGRLPYLVMPFLDCESLEQRIERTGPMGLVDVLTIGLQVARALEAAHAQGLVHRDVKPANILLERAGERVWLADFGLARAVDDATVTASGVIAGTPLFMSPEQARGESIDARSDIFSLGSVLYMMCTGRPPFRAETSYAVLLRIMQATPRPLRELEPTLPAWLQQLINQFHAKDADRRIATAADAARLLEQALRHVQQPDTEEFPAELSQPVRRPVRQGARSQPLFTSHLFPLFKAFSLGGLMMLVLLIIATPIAYLLLLPLAAVSPDIPDTAPLPEARVAAAGNSLVVADAGIGRTVEQPAAKDSKYASAKEAFAVATSYLALKEYAKSREPLEEALKLAPDDEYRIKVYRALIPAYSLIEKWQPKVEALEFIIAHSERLPERSLARSELMSFVRQRGKTKEIVRRYEDQLAKMPDDETALFILTEVYARLTEEPQKAAALLERLQKLREGSAGELSVAESAQLAAQYVKSRKYKEGAELFEKIAPQDKALEAWHYKEAATAWLSAKDKPRALAAAKASAAASPEQRSQLLEYFWHRSLADVFSDVDEPGLAIPHYEQALAKTTIEGYRKETEQRLARARELSK